MEFGQGEEEEEIIVKEDNNLEEENATCRFEVLTRNETSNLVTWIKAFWATLCHLNNLWLWPVPEGLHLKEGPAMLHCILLREEKCPAYSPTECASADARKEKGLGHKNTSSVFFSPNTSKGCSERKTWAGPQKTHNTYLSQRRNSCKDKN